MAKAVTRRPPTPQKAAVPAVPVPFIAQEEAPAVLQPAAAFASAAALMVTEAASDVAAAVETTEAMAETPVFETQQEAAADEPAPVEQEEKIVATAADTIQGTIGADRAQAMFGDLNQRAKTAFEKGGKVLEDMVELSKGNVEALVTSSRAAAKGAETLLQETADYGRKSFEKASGVAKSYGAVKSPTELFQLQSEFAKSSFDAAIAEATRFSEAYVKLVSEVVEPISGRFTVAVDKIKASAL